MTREIMLEGGECLMNITWLNKITGKWEDFRREPIGQKLVGDNVPSLNPTITHAKK